MFVTFFDETNIKTRWKDETQGEFVRRKALSTQSITIDTRHIDSIRRTFKDGKYSNIVSVFGGANEFKVSDDTYLNLLESLTGDAFNANEGPRHFIRL